MLDLTKPRNMNEMAEHDEFFGYSCLNGITKTFRLPLNVYIDSHSVCRKNITEILIDGSEFSYYKNNIYTNVPVAGVEIENYFYYISISENAKMFAPVPEGYEEKTDYILKFISRYYEVFLLHWKRKLNDWDVSRFLITMLVSAPPENIKEFQKMRTEYNHITRKLRKLKKAKKFSRLNI